MTAPAGSAPTNQLPIAEPGDVRRAAVKLVRLDSFAVAAIFVLNALAAAAALAGPWLLGAIINTVTQAAGGDPRGDPTGNVVSRVDQLALAIVIFTLLQIVLTRFALLLGYRFGERTAARVREQFLGRTLRLPASVVERIAIGDLSARGTNDVGNVATSLRDGVPAVFIGLVQAVFILAAIVVINPLLGACGLLCLIGIWFAARWYLKRARTAYLAEGASNSVLADILIGTASGARTVEALSLQRRRLDACRQAIARCISARMRTLFLRTVLFPSVDISYVIPVVGVLLVGGALYENGMTTVGTVAASALYLRQLSGPLDAILLWLEQFQSSGASFARLEGLAEPATSQASSTSTVLADQRIEVTGVRYAYEPGHDVLHGVDLTIRPGERLALVGLSGAGKSTLGRLLAGIDAPRVGTVTVGRVPISELPPEELRRQIVLVTQDHHVFRDSVRDNLLIAAPHATDLELRAALATVGADWLDELPDALDTDLGAESHRLDGGQAQQLTLARVVLANPHTVILDEATALLDPATARNTERALAVVLKGRTVIAIAHRLQTARDADRVAVMDAGQIIEIGAHDDLIAAGDSYAALWQSWHGSSPSPIARAGEADHG